MSRRTRRDPLFEVIPGLAVLIALGCWLNPALLVLLIWGGAIVIVGLVGFLFMRLLARNSSPTVQATDPAKYSAFQPARTSPKTAPLPDILRRIDWFQFEKLAAAIYQAEGYSVQRLGGAKPDGGVDLLIERDGMKTVVQCKHWKTREVPEKEIREFLGTLTDTGIPNGIFISLRGYTQPAEQLARRHRIALVGEAGLTSLLEKVNWKYNPAIQALLDRKQKFCPRCEQPMVQRTAKKGWRAGHPFWGCSAFPRCSYILEAA